MQTAPRCSEQTLQIVLKGTWVTHYPGEKRPDGRSSTSCPCMRTGWLSHGCGGEVRPRTAFHCGNAGDAAEHGTGNCSCSDGKRLIWRTVFFKRRGSCQRLSLRVISPHSLPSRADPPAPAEGPSPPRRRRPVLSAYASTLGRGTAEERTYVRVFGRKNPQ